MNRLFAGVVCVVLTTGTMLGAYLRNVPQVIVQPNGKIVHCLASGDEYHHWLHDSNNYTIVQDPQTGFYVYAVLLNGQLAPSPYVVGEVDPVAAGLRPAANISSRTWSTIRNKRISGMPGVATRRCRAATGRSWNPSTDNSNPQNHEEMNARRP